MMTLVSLARSSCFFWFHNGLSVSSDSCEFFNSIFAKWVYSQSEMSWVKAVPCSGDDVFDENADEMSISIREWSTSMKRRVRDGYVDGVDDGEEASLQVGFNLGFREGAAKTAAVGRLKGILSAISCWYQTKYPKNPVPSSVTELLQKVSEYEDTVVNSIKKALENPPPSVSAVSENMEDLQVNRPDLGSCGEEGCKKTDCCRGGEQMDLGDTNQQEKLCSGSTDRYSGSSESLSYILHRCTDLVSELGLPQDLISHIHEVNTL